MIGLREYLYLAAITVLCGAVYWFGWHERHVGEQIIERADTKAVVIQEKHDAKADTDALDGLKRDNDALRAQLAGAQPHIRVCSRPPDSAPREPPADSGGDHPTAGGGGGQVRAGTVPDASTDIGPSVFDLAAVAELNGSLARACQVDAAKRSAN